MTEPSDAIASSTPAEPGEIILRSHRVQVVEAPELARIHLSALVAADPRDVLVSGDGCITLAGVVTYRPVALEDRGVLLVERITSWPHSGGPTGGTPL